jgi:hypothetical protein
LPPAPTACRRRDDRLRQERVALPVERRDVQPRHRDHAQAHQLQRRDHHQGRLDLDRVAALHQLPPRL